MQDSVNRVLDRLESLGLISTVQYSKWPARVVVVKKANVQLRLCGEYSTGLNDALRPYDYPLLVPDEIFSKLANCKPFTKIDLTDAFLQVEIEPRHRQQHIDKMLIGLNGVSGYLDDIIVEGSSTQELDQNVSEIFKFCADKCSFNQQVNSSERPDPAKIEAIRKLPAPTDITDVRIGIKMYTVKTADQQVIRSHINQLRRRHHENSLQPASI
uniref:Reverse transcriptase domain-containing protein n=1 Tax=Anopheles christyi TaxID=43041 RepID=A0A182KCR5_9DIPT